MNDRWMRVGISCNAGDQPMTYRNSSRGTRICRLLNDALLATHIFQERSVQTCQSSRCSVRESQYIWPLNSIRFERMHIPGAPWFSVKEFTVILTLPGTIRNFFIAAWNT